MELIKTINKIRIALILFAFITGCTSNEKISIEPLNIQPKQMPEEKNFKNLFFPNKEYQYFENVNDYTFRFSSSTFELVNAWWLAETSMLVYVKEDEFVKNSLAKAGLDNVKFFKKDGTQCFIANNNDFIIICFRGTEVTEKQDIITDAKFILVDSKQGGKVHDGFKDAIDTIWEELKNYLQEIRNPINKQTVWFTGHSLGAALAILAANRFGDVKTV